MKKVSIILYMLFFFLAGCFNEEKIIINNPSVTKNLTIFFVNDQHGQLENFSKIKHIVDLEKQSTNVIVACSGDIFSGNPVVDNYPEKGYPMIDIMNRVGFDISVVGNHEYDYGELVLKDRFDQAAFDWVCANVDMSGTDISQPFAFKTISKGELNVTFLGLVETNGKDNATIPSTHPLKVQNLIFERPENVVAQYANVKEEEDSDLYIALTHIGHGGNSSRLGDFTLAEQFPYFDLIIGGHSHQIINAIANDIPVFQSGSYLNNLGKIELSVKNKSITSISFDLINLNTYMDFDPELKSIIDEYNDLPFLNEVIGYSHVYHDRSQVGCFYTDAFLGLMNVDVAFQNTGGVRSSLDEGDITKREIFEISPFNNGTLIYEMSVLDIKNFLAGSGSGLYYAGIQIEQIGNEIEIRDLNNNVIDDNSILTIGINDYIPAVNDDYFPQSGELQPLTAAETLISYLETVNDQVNYTDCGRYFRYD